MKIEVAFLMVTCDREGIEWLTDNGKIFTAIDTQNIAKAMGIIPCQTPAYSPESNVMSEAFVKPFKQDYVYVNEDMSAKVVLLKISNWVRDYNENHPKRVLKCSAWLSS